MKLMSLKECHEFLGVSESTLRRYMKAGLPYNQIVKRGRVLFNRDEVIKWISKFRIPHLKLLKRRRGKLNE
jgi:predicted site-specific integrase-resolvase